MSENIVPDCRFESQTVLLTFLFICNNNYIVDFYTVKTISIIIENII